MNLLELFVKISAKDEASGTMESMTSGVIAKAQLMANAIQGALTAAINAITSFIGSAMSAYGTYEQQVGAMETFFGDSASTVIDNAQRAYQSAGMSANQYMSTVSSFAMSLINSTAQQRQGALQQDTSAQAAALDEQVSNLRESLSDQLSAMQSAGQAAIRAQQKINSKLLAARQEELSDELDARREELANELDALRDSLDDEVKAFQKATDEKIRDMNREFDEKMRLMDEEEKRKLGAIDDELDALDAETEAERKAQKERERNEKLSELRRMAETSKTATDRALAEKELAEYTAKIEAEKAEEVRDERRSELRRQREDIRDQYSQLRSDAKDEYSEELESYKDARSDELEALKESNAQKLKEAQKHNERVLKEMQREHQKEIEAMRDAQQEQIEAMQSGLEAQISAQRKANDQQVKNLEKTVKKQKELLKSGAGDVSEFIKATAEDQARATELADMAIRDMADIVNKTGNSMESIQDAYRGFSRDNFTMLDNLGLGYQGTREEMERLLADAESIQASYGELRDYSVDSFADIVEAIHVVAVENGIAGLSVDELKEKMSNHDFTIQELTKLSEAWYGNRDSIDAVKQSIEDNSKTFEDFSVLLGTTAKEGNDTYEGSINRVKAAWENWLVALSSGDPQEVETKTTELVEAAADAAGLLIPRVVTILKTLAEEVGKRAPEIWQTFRTELEKAIPKEDQQKFEDMKTSIDNIGTAIENVAGFFVACGNVVSWLTREVQGFIDTFGGIAVWLNEFPSLIQFALGDKDALTDNGKAIVEGFVNGAEYEWDFSGKGFFENIGGWIQAHKGPVEEDRKLLEPAGRAIMQGLHNGASSSEWNTVKTFFTSVPNTILKAFSGADTLLTRSGTDVIGGLESGFQQPWRSVGEFLGAAPDTMRRFFDGSDSLLNSAGSQIMNGLNDGISSMWGNVYNMVADMPSMLFNVFDNAGDWLFGAGQSILDGLWNGMLDVWGDFSNWVGDIGSWIAENKGPEEYDKRLLIPNGEWIMESLERGMRRGIPEVQGVLEDITDMMHVDASISGEASGRTVATQPPTVIIENFNARSEEDLYYFAEQISAIWSREVAGSLI